MRKPGNEVGPRAGGQGRLRASRADREQVVDTLKSAFAQGRLDRDEFDLRVGRALESRTYADLAALTVGIPARLARAGPPQPARAPVGKKGSVNKKAVAATACATGALVGIWPVMMLTPPWPSFVLPVALLWFVLVMAVPTGWLVLLHDWLDKRAGRRSAQGLPADACKAAS